MHLETSIISFMLSFLLQNFFPNSLPFQVYSQALYVRHNYCFISMELRKQFVFWIKICSTDKRHQFLITLQAIKAVTIFFGVDYNARQESSGLINNVQTSFICLPCSSLFMQFFYLSIYLSIYLSNFILHKKYILKVRLNQA